jgi:hypothetical protein
MAAADYRLMTEATGQRIAAALEALSGFGAYLTTGDVVNNLNSTATDKPLAAAQGKALNDAIAQSTADVIRTGDVVNNLTSTDPTKALAAPQGKALYDIITNNQTNTQTSNGVNCKYVVRSGYCYIRLSGRPTKTDNITFTVPMALVGAYLTCGQWADTSHHMQVFIDDNTNVIIIRNHIINNINVSIVYPVG